jgi:hypothetical protein
MHPSFVKSAMFDAWMRFQTMVKQRLALMTAHLTSVPRRACGDMEVRFSASADRIAIDLNHPQCGEIRTKAEFMRCGGCHAVYYCSSNCQREDWRHGRHHAQCNMIPALSFGEVVSFSFSENEV